MSFPVEMLRGYIDDAILTKIKLMLDDDSGRLDTHQPTNHSVGRFGGSTTAGSLSTHAATAHQHVIEALEEMVDGLRGYRAGVTDFGRHVVDAEDATATDLNRVLMRTDSASRQAGGNDFRDPDAGAQTGGY
jgi:hypothetical protein